MEDRLSRDPGAAAVTQYQEQATLAATIASTSDVWREADSTAPANW